jgi:3-oxoacyl-[acyl-carrier protein] reductase
MTEPQPKVAIVTGAERGIGAAIAARLAREGFDIALLDLDEAGCHQGAKAIVESGGRAIGARVDVSDGEQVEQVVAQVAEELGAPTVLVNNAGITRDNLVFRMTEADWDSVLGVHLRGAFLMSRAAQRYMTELGWGRIVNLSSTSALGNRGQANYAAAKAGMQGLTKTLAIELGRFGVTANAIAPGFIATEMTAATAARLGVSFADYQATRAAEIPVRRVGQPEDIANVTAFLVSDEASFVSGQVIYVAGGPKA